MNKKGMVYLVGAGPGDPELLTIKGEARLKECEVVIYDRLAADSLLDLVPADSEKLYVGKEVGRHSFNQEEINELIVKKALEGKQVVRLKGGDPFVFGRGGEEVMALQQEEIPFEVIPGITSAIAAATYAGIPVTHRGVSQSFHVITGHTRDSKNQLTDNYEVLAKLEGTLIFLMGLGNLSLIVSELLKYGKDGNTPAAVISEGTTGRQKTVKGTLADIAFKVSQNNIKSPAIIIIGGVVELNMKEEKSGRLTGKRIGVTGTKNLTDKLTGQLRQFGAEVHNLGFLQVKEYTDNQELAQAAGNLKSYTWIVFTSTNGVDLFFEYLKKQQIDYRQLALIKFAVVGSGTKDALLKQGFAADYMPETYTTAALAKGLVNILKEEDRVLIPRALNGSKDLAGILEKHHIPYTDIKLYTIVIEEEKKSRVIKELSGYDYITFASSSGVEGFFDNAAENLSASLKHTVIVSIGEVTAKCLEGYGITGFISAKEFSVKGIVESILYDTEKSN
jgi:uroporphyrinogen III methyltransferase/synthase